MFIEKMKIKKKEAGNGPFEKQMAFKNYDDTDVLPRSSKFRKCFKEG